MDKIKKLLLNDYIFSIINKMSSIIVGVFSSALINRYLGPELKGQYIYIINIVNIVVIVANLGFYQSYPNRKKSGMERQLETYVDAFTFQFIVYLAIALFVSLFVKTPLYICALILVPIQVLTNQLAMIALVEFIRYRQILQILMLFFNLFLCIIAYFFIPQHVIVAMLILMAKDLMFILLYMIKIKYIPNPFHISISFFKYLFSFGVFAMLSALLINLNYKLDILMLTQYVDFREVGLYSTGVALAEYAWIIPDAFKDVLFSRTAKSNAVDQIILSIKLNLFIVVFILAGILLLGRQVIFLLYGIEYIEAYQSTCLVFLGIPSMVLFKLIGPLYLSNGKQKLYFITLCISVGANFIVNLILIPTMGKNGAAIATIVSYSVSGLIFYIKFVKDYQIKWYIPLILKPADVRSLVNKIGRN